MDWSLISAGLENADNLKSRVAKDIWSSLEMGESVVLKEANRENSTDLVQLSSW